MPHPQAVQGIAFHPQGRALATACVDGAARLWDARSGKPLGMPMPHEGPVERVLFSPDGQTLLTAGREHAARLWRPPAAIAGDADRLILWTEVVTGQTLDADAGVRVLDAETWQQRQERLNQLGGFP
jgi:WD40 repeat protein